MAYNPLLQKITIPALATAGTYALPAGATLLQITAKNNTANAVTGGLKFGTTAGGVDIVAALALAASVISAPATLLFSRFSGAQTIYIDAVVAWNSATADIQIIYIA